jgi:hypothetical protein
MNRIYSKHREKASTPLWDLPGSGKSDLDEVAHGKRAEGQFHQRTSNVKRAQVDGEESEGLKERANFAPASSPE